MRKLVRRLPLLAGFLLLASCGETDQDIFHPDGKAAEKINDLQIWVFIAAGVVGVFVAIALFYVMASGRRRRLTDDDEPKQIHGNFGLEITWTIAPALVLLVVGIFTVAVFIDISRAEKDALKVKVFGQQWWWSYEYDTNGDGTSDIITANELVIPAGTPVELELAARDVIHSFWIPALAGAKDVVPGRVHTMSIEADAPGEWQGQCKEFCGLSHANMRARAIALSEDDWEQWLEEQQEEAARPEAESLAAKGETAFAGKCASCHFIKGARQADGQPLPDVSYSAELEAGHAPNLTHLMSRKVFASATFPLWIPNGDGKLEFNRNQLEAWLRDPPAMIPMEPEADERTGAKPRGMPNLELTEEEIDQLVAYLETLGPYPDGAIPPSSTGGG